MADSQSFVVTIIPINDAPIANAVVDSTQEDKNLVKTNVDKALTHD